MKKQFITGCFALGLGGLIYIAFRSNSLRMFNWFSALSLEQPIQVLRVSITALIKGNLPMWLLFSLPDGLWVFSYITITLLLWKNRISKHNIFWLLSIPLIAILTEIGQGYEVIKVTFDLIDLAFYLLGTIAPLSIFTKNHHQIKQID